MQTHYVALGIDPAETIMPKHAVLEIEATVTERGQTTVPAAIRRMLRLGKRGSIVFRGLPDGTVVVAAKEGDGASDPVLRTFLDFLARDMQSNPAGLQPANAEIVARARYLTGEVEVDLDAPLKDD